MAKYEYDDEIAPADCAFRAFGETLEELFVNAALATTAVMVDLETLGRSQERQIALSAPDLEQLLYDWLEEIVYIKDHDVLLFSDYSVTIAEGNPATLSARAWGERIDVHRHRLYTDVKAVTLHRFALTRTKGGWQAFVVLDL